VVRVPGYTTEMYCVSCEVRTEFICYVEESRPPLWSSGQSASSNLTVSVQLANKRGFTKKIFSCTNRIIV
jgi:hypothetical protein